MEISITSTKKIALNADFIRSFFRDYKDFILPVSVIFGCIMILFFVVIPQLNQYFQSSQELSTETQKLNLLKNNYNYLLNLDDTKTNADLKTLSKILPSNKDFTGILNALSVVSSKTNVAIGNFSFSLGDLAKTNLGGTLSSPTIKMDVNLSGNAQGVLRFISELKKTAPLSEASVIKGTGSNYLLTVTFFYKPFPPQNVSDDAAIIPFTSQNTAFIKELAGWNNTTDQDAFSFLPPVGNSSSSASNPNPF